MINLSGPAEVAKALDHHVYARFSTSMAANVCGLAGGDAVLWWGDTHFGRLGHAFGPREGIDRLVDAGRDEFGEVRWINVPRPPGEVANGWDFRWTTKVPEWTHDYQMVPVDDHDALNELLDAGFPDSAVRPGHPIVAVHPDFRGRGLGKAISASLTALLLERHGLSCLGVMPDNQLAQHMYVSLGYEDMVSLHWIHPSSN